MSSLKDLLPPSKLSKTSLYDHSNDPWFKERYRTSSDTTLCASIKTNPIQPYLKCWGFVPRKPEDFGNGGAFPEIHVAQYPLGMGRKDQKLGSKITRLLLQSIPPLD